MSDDREQLTALALVCSLKPSPAPSSSELIAEHVLGHLRKAGVQCESVRCVDHAIAPGVEADMGDGDEWPTIRQKVLAADILVFSTPIWVGASRRSMTRCAMLDGWPYWTGPAMGSTDYGDLDEVPEAVASTTATVARNAVHLAKVLTAAEYPAYE